MSSLPTPAEHNPEGSSLVGPVRVRVFGRTDVGQVREHNEDNFLVADLTRQRRSLLENDREQTVGPRGTLFGVCDGMGGAAAGEIASQLAVDVIYERMIEGEGPRDRNQLARRLIRAIEVAGGRIYQESKADRARRGMGTTATIAALLDSHLFLGQVGDSRGYLLRGTQFVQVTRDQSLVNQLIESGQLTEEEAETFEHNNIILQALGTSDTVQVDLTYVELRRGDVLLLCSDGLSGMIRPNEMREVLETLRDPLEACKVLTEQANQSGGHDNITCIVAVFDGPGLAEPTEEDELAYCKYPLPEEAGVDRTGPTQRMRLPTSVDGSDDGGPASSDAALKHEETDRASSLATTIPVRGSGERFPSLSPGEASARSARKSEEDPVHLPIVAAPSWMVGLFVAFALGFVAFMGFYLLR